ncbi:MAG: hypothetical protein P8K76_03720 [Candidatus Binatia bacterium]|nr:hypothetical protein [Candidatus Binatia bacterium]MDG2008873.1 hypothetical protein [Candidatus Binatia bacterium]
MQSGSCTSFDADGFPDDWGGNTRCDEASTGTVDESTLGACCGATENKYCFEVVHFSTYAILDPNCGLTIWTAASSKS